MPRYLTNAHSQTADYIVLYGFSSPVHITKYTHKRRRYMLPSQFTSSINCERDLQLLLIQHGAFTAHIYIYIYTQSLDNNKPHKICVALGQRIFLPKPFNVSPRSGHFEFLTTFSNQSILICTQPKSQLAQTYGNVLTTRLEKYKLTFCNKKHLGL